MSAHRPFCVPTSSVCLLRPPSSRPVNLFGRCSGLELREGTYSISPKNKETVRPHMCFNVAVSTREASYSQPY